ncbi:MAG: biopolymer transporter ExbD [Kiritimatiellae bacterium]|nr:biopolymer transporter ExbD [Kiritimatiellia bacterium]
MNHQPLRTGTFERTFRTRLARSPSPLDAAAVASVLVAAATWWILRMPFIAQPAVPIELPPAASAEPVRYGTLIVAVTADGRMFACDRPVDLAELARHFETAVRERPDTTVLIEADRRVPQELLVRIYDLAARVGIRRAEIATQMPARSAPETSR